MANDNDIEAVAFDCFGTLIDFDDGAFVEAYGLICAEQGFDIDGAAFYAKWMEIWRRISAPFQDAPYSNGFAQTNSPAPLSAMQPLTPAASTPNPSAYRNRALDGPITEFRTYREEWVEHFELCFAELGVQGDATLAHDRLREVLAAAQAYPEARRVVERVGRRLPIAVMSNADDDFLQPPLTRNGLAFPVIVSSESARAYKPHVAIFHYLSEAMGTPAAKILYVGDSKLADVTGAKHAGMKAAWVNRSAAVTEWNTDGRRLLQPDYEIETLDGLLEVLGL